ncbi:hypothetical protein RvY_01444-2 [Ramazzottius varieornatus]|nr:hypothetical protein RvY_01444-2 [Ramazzottius varieornatus]
MAVCFTHPLDLLKVYLQTHDGGRLKIIPIAVKIVRTEGVAALYSGISASLLRQLTQTTARFGMYEMLKTDGTKQRPFSQKLLAASASGAFGGFVGAPADLINVRMQNDVKLPLAERRNYNHAIDGLIRVCREEGILRLWRGSSMVISRSVLLTMGQLSLYDQVKQILIKFGFPDSVTTHLLGSSVAACSSAAITAPFDVVKTRMQNTEPGKYKNIRHCIRETAKLGPLAFFKGFLPSLLRVGPQTILMFLLYEQMRLRFGVKIEVDPDAEHEAEEVPVGKNFFLVTPKNQRTSSG